MEIFYRRSVWRKDIEKQMREAAKNYEFEKAAEIRDKLKEMRKKEDE